MILGPVEWTRLTITLSQQSGEVNTTTVSMEMLNYGLLVRWESWDLNPCQLSPILVKVRWEVLRYLWME